MPRVVFAGSPGFCLETIDLLHRSFDLVGIMTQPDKPKGRGKRVIEGPVKSWCVMNNVPVFQPQRIDESIFMPKDKELLLIY